MVKVQRLFRKEVGIRNPEAGSIQILDDDIV